MSDTDERMLVALRYEYEFWDHEFDNEMERQYESFEQREREDWPEELRIDPDKWLGILAHHYDGHKAHAAFAKDYAEQLAACIDNDVNIELDANFVERIAAADFVVLDVSKDAVRAAATIVRVAGAKQLKQFMEYEFSASAAELWEVGIDNLSPRWAGALLDVAWQVLRKRAESVAEGLRCELCEHLYESVYHAFQEGIDWQQANADLEGLRQEKMAEQGEDYIPCIRCRNTPDLFLDYLPSLLTGS